jgi:hypothetical protein
MGAHVYMLRCADALRVSLSVGGRRRPSRLASLAPQDDAALMPQLDPAAAGVNFSATPFMQ